MIAARDAAISALLEEREGLPVRPAAPRLRLAESPLPERWRRPPAAPLLAVCGLCGGAGASLLSYLLARDAIGRRDGHVLVCDTGGPTGGLSAYAGVESPQSLAEAADDVARGLPLTVRCYAVDSAVQGRNGELRVIATGPRFAGATDANAINALVAIVRDADAHALTVIDCGTLQREVDRVVLAAASHVAWVLPASPCGVRRAGRVLSAAPAQLPARHLLIARREPQQTAAGLKALKALNEQRRAPLVLVPYVPGLPDDVERALDHAQVSLQAIHGALQR